MTANNPYSLKHDAKALKEAIAAFLFLRDPEGVVSSEVMFGSSRNVADMVFISKGYSYGIEIKSEFDNTLRLEGQLQEYLLLFDYVLVFTAPKHIDKISPLISEAIGLYCISENGIRRIKREKRNRRVQKTEMLLSIPSAAIKTFFSIKGKLSSDDIRAKVLRKSKVEIHRYFIDYYSNKLLSHTNHTKTLGIPEPERSPDDYIIV